MEKPTFVTDQHTLTSLCDQWRAAGLIAFDTEFIRDDTFDATLCLIQVAHNGDVWLIDPTADIDVTCFWELVADPDVVTVVHAGKEDFELCLRAIGQPPRNVFDVQLAAGFVGLGYPLSLLRLVEQLLRRRLSKGQTLTDWLRRPLTENQVHYAVEDVLHLPRIHELLKNRVQRAKRSAWLAEELKRFEDPAFYQITAEERAQRLKGSKRLDPVGLYLLEQLVDWRAKWAREKNRPIRAMMRDDVLVEIARRRPRKASDLEVLRGFPQARNRKVVGEILQLIQNCGNVPKESLPQPAARREDTPMAKAMLDLLSAVTQATCHKQRLSRNLLGGAQRLRDALDYHAGRLDEPPELLQGWRREFIGDQLLTIAGGRSEIHVSGWPDDPQLDVVLLPKKARRAE